MEITCGVGQLEYQLMNMIRQKKTWKEKYNLSDKIEPSNILNGMKVDECSQIQQMVYHLAEKIKSLEDRIKTLEGK